MALVRSFFVALSLICLSRQVLSDDCARLVSNATNKAYAVLTAKVETMTNCDDFIGEIKVKRVFKVPKSIGIVRGSLVRVKMSGINASFSSDEDFLSCFGVYTEPSSPRVQDTKLFYLVKSTDHPFNEQSILENNRVNSPLYFDLLFPVLPITLANLDRASAASKGKLQLIILQRYNKLSSLIKVTVEIYIFKKRLLNDKFFKSPLVDAFY